MDLLLENYQLILGLVMIAVMIGFCIYKFFTQPSEKRKNQIRAILLNLVITAEKYYGSSTGKLKFSYVYSELITKLPYLKYIPLSVVEKLIDEALVEMRHLLETNDKVYRIVNGGGDK